MLRIFLILKLFLLQSCSCVESSELVKKNACTCEDYQQIYECTIFGEGATVWRGSAFNCPGTNNEIVLFHTTYHSVQRSCNDGAITARIIRVESNFYTSQLAINVSGEIIGQNITCAEESGVHLNEIGTLVLRIESEIPPPPIDINLFEESPKHLSFIWSAVSFNCPLLHYHIVASNCGQCPTVTSNTSVTCNGNYVEVTTGLLCSFAVQSVACGNIAGDVSMALNVIWRDVNACASPTNATETELLSAETGILQYTQLSRPIVFGGTVGGLGAVIIALTSSMIIVTAVLLKSKRALKEELNLLRANTTKQPAIYEEIVLESLKSSSPSIDTGENTAYISALTRQS